MSVIYKACFRALSDELSPDKILSQIGGAPSSMWGKGEPRSAMSHLLHKENGIEFESQVSELQSLEEHLLALRAKLHPLSSNISRAHIDKIVSCSVNVFGDDRPEIYLSADTLKFLGLIEASVDIDIMYYP